MVNRVNVIFVVTFVTHRLATQAPFGQLPVLEYEGRTYAQSGALYRFIARKCNLEGANDHEFALNSMLIEVRRDRRIVDLRRL